MNKYYLERVLGQLDLMCDSLENGDICRTDLLNQFRSAIHGAIEEVVLNLPRSEETAEKVIEEVQRRIRNVEAETAKNRELFESCATQRCPDLYLLKSIK